MANVYLALLHHPVYNKRKMVVSTCITGFDLHDIARSSLTYGLKGYFVVNPLPAQRAFAQRMLDFWSDEESLEFNWTRAAAFKLISIKENLEEAIADITKIEGKKPTIVGTSAKPQGTVKFKDLRAKLKKSNDSYLIVLGTGWGIIDEYFENFDLVLAPIEGPSDYNHLSVRSACAIILDRLLGV